MARCARWGPRLRPVKPRRQNHFFFPTSPTAMDRIVGPALAAKVAQDAFESAGPNLYGFLITLPWRHALKSMRNDQQRTWHSRTLSFPREDLVDQSIICGLERIDEPDALQLE